MLRVRDLEEGGILENRYQLVQKLGESRLAVVWEVADLALNGDRKAIKFCKSHNYESVMLLRREFLTLQRLHEKAQHGETEYIVRVEKLYPSKKPDRDDRIPLHFFVLEKVRGFTLEELIARLTKEQRNQQNSFWRSLHQIYQLLFYRYPPLRSGISYLQIANWIEQLTRTLKYLHSQDLIYSDLKPANIMITDDGDLKLIDFGAVKNIEDTTRYQQEFNTQSATIGLTPEYAAPEQQQGQVLCQSDFYSFGLTILFALTGSSPSTLKTSSRGKWRSLFPPELSNFLVKAIQEDPLKRHLDVNDLSKEARQVARSLRYQFGKWAVIKQMLAVAGVAAIATTSILLLRSTGILQTWELQAYDQMVKIRPDQGADPRLLIIDIPRETQLISDQLLVDILSRLRKYNPKVIGIPLIRDQERPTTLDSATNLQKIFQQNKNIVGLCVHTDSDRQRLSYPFLPTTNIPIGFGNSSLDSDGSLRRHLLMYQEVPKDQCLSNISFALLISHQYLQIPLPSNAQMLGKTYNMNQAIFHSLEVGQGVYQDRTMIEFENLFQIMIDYRSPNIAEIMPVSHLLETDLPLEKFRDRIVLIGRASINRDTANIKTPYAKNVDLSNAQITAQIISQLISVAQGDQSILRPASPVTDLFSILSLSSFSAFLGWRIISRTRQIKYMLTLLIFICLGYFYFFIFQGLWLGLIPAIASSVIANLSVITYTKYQYKLMGEM